MSSLSLEQKICQMLMGWYRNRDNALRLVKRGYGGIWPHGLAGSSVRERSEEYALLQQAAAIPLIIGVDCELGAGQMTDELTVFPNLMAFGACRDGESLARAAGEITGQEARALGVHLSFSPVADTNTVPENPISNVRSVSDDPELVSKIAVATIQGMQSRRLVATAKHFPGEGMHSQDPHFSKEIMEVSLDEMEQIHLVPFEAAVRAGVRCIMTNHAVYPPYDASRPATTSSRVLDILRTRMGYQGLILTDGMGMQGVASAYGPVEAVIEAVRAGHDLILAPREDDDVVAGLMDAVSSGLISESRIDESVLRILSTKEWLGLLGEPQPSEGQCTEWTKEASQAVAQRVARESITLIRDRDGLIPLRSDRRAKVTVLEPVNPRVTLDIGLHMELTSLIAAVKERFDSVDAYQLPLTFDEGLANAICESASVSDFVLISTSFKQKAGQVGLLCSSQIEYLRQACAGSSKAVAIVANPYTAAQLGFIGTVIACYSPVQISVDAALDVAFGEIRAEGKLPVRLPSSLDQKRVDEVFSTKFGV